MHSSQPLAQAFWQLGRTIMSFLGTGFEQATAFRLQLEPSNAKQCQARLPRRRFTAFRDGCCLERR